jgi:hypothetical protein
MLFSSFGAYSLCYKSHLFFQSIPSITSEYLRQECIIYTRTHTHYMYMMHAQILLEAEARNERNARERRGNGRREQRDGNGDGRPPLRPPRGNNYGFGLR